MKTCEQPELRCNDGFTSDGAPITTPEQGDTITSNRGFTVTELLAACAIVGCLAAVALPSYPILKNMARNSRAASEIHTIQNAIAAFQAERGVYPPDLAATGLTSIKDPWGNAYVYRLSTSTTGLPRKDKYLNLLNDDYDLYSLGSDGATSQTTADAPDDIVRAANGSFAGLASKYDEI